MSRPRISQSLGHSRDVHCLPVSSLRYRARYNGRTNFIRPCATRNSTICGYPAWYLDAAAAPSPVTSPQCSVRTHSRTHSRTTAAALAIVPIKLHQRMRISLLRDCDNKYAASIFSSCATGKPLLCAHAHNRPMPSRRQSPAYRAYCTLATYGELSTRCSKKYTAPRHDVSGHTLPFNQATTAFYLSRVPISGDDQPWISLLAGE